MRSEEWWRRALELLSYQLHTNSKIPFYIARRDLNMDSTIKYKKGALGRFMNCAPLPPLLTPHS